jgi:hypothetical protein
MRTYARNKIAPPAPLQIAASTTLSPQDNKSHGPRSAKIVDLAQVDVDVATHLDHDMELAISSAPHQNTHTAQDITTRATASMYGDAFFQEATLVDNEVSSGTEVGGHSAVSSRKQVGSSSSRTWVGPRPRNPSKGMSESSLARVPEANTSAPEHVYSPSMMAIQSSPVDMSTAPERRETPPPAIREPPPQPSYTLPVSQSAHVSPIRALPNPSSSGMRGRIAHQEPQYELGTSPTSAIRPLPILPGARRG